MFEGTLEIRVVAMATLSFVQLQYGTETTRPSLTLAVPHSQIRLTWLKLQLARLRSAA